MSLLADATAILARRAAATAGTLPGPYGGTVYPRHLL